RDRGRRGRAVEEATRRAPDRVLLQLQPPGLNRFQGPGGPKRRDGSARVIMYSGDWIDTGTAIRCIKAGACDYLTKPFDPGSVIERIRRHLVLERTLTTQVSELLPLEQKLIEGAENLQRPNETLSSRYSALVGQLRAVEEHD